MATVFAPYCPTCQTRVLLGPRRLVAAHLGPRPFRVDVRCFCGTVVASDNPVPRTRRVTPPGPVDRVA